ncbi:MAG: diadenylate cyclase CdaA [bacterium]
MSYFITNLLSYFIASAKASPIIFLIDILVVAILIYWALVFIKGTRASKIIVGFILLGVILIIGRFLQLETINWVVRHLATLIIVTIPIVFQPELRRALEKLGHTKWFKSKGNGYHSTTSLVVDIVSRAVKTLTKNSIGSLIVIKRETGLDDIIETGVMLDAKLTPEILLQIFFPNSPLHDGAVVIKANRVAAASVKLPLSEQETAYPYGTRHRAALGISEETDALVVVTSEESGQISLAENSKIKNNLKINDLEIHLEKLLKSRRAKISD